MAAQSAEMGLAAHPWVGVSVVPRFVERSLAKGPVERVACPYGPVAGRSHMVAEKGPVAQDGEFWKFLAYCAGTGGSCLIIGSAAGVAIMGILKIDFIWYLKKISVLALMGYVSGAATYYVMFAL